MNKYIAFFISFIIVFVLLQWGTGVVHTMMYAPDIEKAWNANAKLSPDVGIKASSNIFITLFVALLSATIAYFISRAVEER